MSTTRMATAPRITGDYVGTLDASRLLGLSPRTVARYADDGTLPVERTPGGQRRIPRAAVEAYARGERAA